MTDKIFGTDFANSSAPQGTWTLSINDGSVLKDVALSDLHVGLSQWLRDGDGVNYTISATISGTNLVFAIKGMDGNDPSTSNPVAFRIGATRYVLTAPVSYVMSSGGNFFNAGGAELAGQSVDYFVYAIQETGGAAGIKFGHSRIPYATTMGDFINSGASEKYIAGNYSAFNSTDLVRNIGRFRAQLSAGASYNWSIPSAKVISRPTLESDWLNWTPVHTRATTPYTNVPVNEYAKYIISNKRVIFNEGHTQNATPGGSGVQRVTAPFVNATRIILGGMDVSVAFGVFSFFEAGGNSYLIFKYDGSDPTTASHFYGTSGVYEI